MKTVHPTKQDLLAAVNRRVPDVIAPGLAVLFCGINPGLYSAATGFHFARPGNRFWPALHAGGFTPRILAPIENRLLLDLGYGLTNIVGRATARAEELSVKELLAGRRRLEKKILRFAPRWIAILGITAYRIAFQQPRAVLGPQPETVGATGIWVLPNPSGLNANHQPPDLARAFRMLRAAAHPPG
ncbi:MAG TPA: G/U mismatch-specific DNA glycosylase [Gemmatimonadales bacterium]|nr:G/U mismatch-specific DNA glycosylase [Gemmatimonadales bacterium]